MENQSNQATKKGIILLLGIIIGLLAGVLVAFIVESKIRPKSTSVVKVVPSEPSGDKDTVYKYIVHQYQNSPDAAEGEAFVDSLQTDSLFMEESAMNLMLDEEDEAYEDLRSTTVSSEKLISRHEAPILYFDSHKNAMEAPENAPKSIEVQFWSTPIQNKIVYQFDNNVLKIKGLKMDNAYVIHYNNRYYLQSDRQVFQIQPTTDYKRLTEIHDAPFM
ncbi:MAG: hypothetical protein J6X98_07365 [Bacteroidales bacterium]|nr:hypothetical protein [Bacteroidales bacterium]